MEQPGTPAPGRERFQVWSMHGNPYLGPKDTLLGRYPTLPADTTWGNKGGPDSLSGPSDWAIVVEWSVDHDLDEIAPEIPGGGANARQLVPTLPGQSARLSPLMNWWLLLFGLSIFARYHPGLWAGSLRVDQSPSAVPLEAVLEADSRTAAPNGVRRGARPRQ
jgi:hypothetical protein